MPARSTRLCILAAALFIATAAAVPAAGTRVTFGSLSFHVPPGWEVTKEPRRIHAAAPSAGDDSVSEFFLLGPAPDNGKDLSHNLDQYTANTFSEYALAESRQFRLELPSGLENRAANARFVHKKDNKPLYAVIMVIRHSGSLYFFTFDSDSQSRFGDFRKNAFVRMMNGMVAAGGKGEDDRDRGRTVKVALAGFTVPVPADWKQVQGRTPPGRMLFSVPHGLRVKGQRPFTALVVPYVGTPVDAENELKTWAVRNFLPAAGVRTGPDTVLADGKTVGPGPKGKSLHTFTAGYRAPGKAKIYRITAILFRGEGHSLLAGLLGEYDEGADAAAVKALMAREEALAGALALSAAASSYAPQAKQAQWEYFLGRKEEWNWRMEQGAGPDGGPEAGTVRWKFSPDGNCAVSSTDLAALGFSLLGLPDPGRYVALTAEGDRLKEELMSSFEVRGSGSRDLWIVLKPKAGLGTIHRFEPLAEGQFFGRKTKGVAIDGRIEGRYFKDAEGRPAWKAR